MKKITLLTATALTIAGLSGQTLVAQAAPRIQITQPAQSKQVELCQNGNKVVISYGSGCNTQNIFNNLQNCFPNLNLPENCFPSINLPETDLPETNVPDADTPGNNTPDNNNPGNNGSTDTTPEESPEEDSSDDNIHAYVKKVIDLVNVERAKEGLSALTMDLQVQAAAQVRAMECEQLFSHTRPDGTSFATALKEQNVSYRRAGENIAWGQRTPEQVVSGWMNSEGHRANIMNANFTKIGVGYYQNAKGTNYWCQLFTN